MASLLVVLYCGASLASYFAGVLNWAASPLVATKLAAICLGLLFDSMSQNERVDGYFLAMTLLIAADAYFSFKSSLRY